MKDNVNLYHNDNVSIVSIIDDIYDERNMKGKTVKVVICCLCHSNIKSYAMKLLKSQYEYEKEYKRYGVKFIIFNDFEKDDKYNDYKHYYYHYKIMNQDGCFRVDYKVLEDK